jgi:hypothetical protein
MRFALVPLLAGTCWPAVMAGQPVCADISSVDFGNRVIVAEGEARPGSYGVFNGPGPAGPIRLTNGRYYEWDGLPETPVGTRKPDWVTKIEGELLVHPPQSGGVRVLRLSRTHLTGTGSFTYVLAFMCQRGSVSKVFEASGQGLKLESVTDAAIDLSVAVWAKHDDHASPSKVVSLRYEWSPRSRRYVRASSNGACPWMP